MPLPSGDDDHNYTPLDNGDVKTMVLEDIIRTCEELGVTWYEIAATQIIPSYSFVPDCLQGAEKSQKVWRLTTAKHTKLKMKN